MQKINVLIDCDPGHDDVMAILLALANRDKLNILGVSTVAGNQTLDKVTLNVRKLYTYLGIKTPIAVGMERPIIRELKTGDFVHGESGLDGFEFPEPTVEADSTNAIIFMREKLLSCHEKSVLIATGPLTNVGLLLRTFPEVKDKIEYISLMGGSIFKGNVTPFAEYNIYADPEAAHIVFNSGIPIVMSGLDVTHKAYITNEDILELERIDGKVTRMCAKLLKFFTKFHTNEGYKNFPLHDVCAVMYVLNKDIFEGQNLLVDIDTSDTMHRGRTAADLREWVIHENTNTLALLDVDREKFIHDLFAAFIKLDKELI
ncbi:MAG: nucleoside hydrolase [Tissierellales bacterium]|nr:nucleoside hydrolase [Tissierellales bacterium]